MIVKMDVDYSFSLDSDDIAYLENSRSGRYQGQGISRPRDVEVTDLNRSRGSCWPDDRPSSRGSKV